MYPLDGSRAPPNTPNCPAYVNVTSRMYTPHTSCATLTYLNSTDFQYKRRRIFTSLFFFRTAVASVPGLSCVFIFTPEEDFGAEHSLGDGDGDVDGYDGEEEEEEEKVDIDVACDVTVRVDVNDEVDTLVDIDCSGDDVDTAIGDDPGCRSTIFCGTIMVVTLSLHIFFS